MGKPRIRSVKPEFWDDPKILDLTDSCAMFFLALWNFCDDEGKFPYHIKAITANVCRWKSHRVKGFIAELLDTSLLRVSDDNAWLQVTNWKHQRIDHPVIPKIKACEIQWVKSNSSRIETEDVQETSGEGSDRIGSEGIGSKNSVVVKKSEDVDPPAPTYTIFEVEKDLKGIDLLERTLIFVSPTVQKSWLTTYKNPNWIQCKLLDAVCYYLAKQNALEPAHVPDWGMKLVLWLGREKKPVLIDPGSLDRDSGETSDSFSFFDEMETEQVAVGVG